MVKNPWPCTRMPAQRFPRQRRIIVGKDRAAIGQKQPSGFLAGKKLVAVAKTKVCRAGGPL